MRGELEFLREKPSQSRVENQHQAQPTNGVEPRIKPRPHWRKVSGLTSAPTVLIGWHFTEIILKQPNKCTKLNGLRIPTCRRQTRWLCTSKHRLGVELQVTWKKPAPSVRAGFEVWQLNTLPISDSTPKTCTCGNHMLIWPPSSSSHVRNSW